MTDRFKKLRDAMAASHPGKVGPIVTLSVSHDAALALVRYREARAAVLDAAAAVASFLGTADPARINADLPKHAEHAETQATEGLADVLAGLYAANDAWQRAQVERFAPHEADDE